MASITELQSGDLITDSRTDINNNFTNLNNDKIETSVLDTDTTLAANSDSKVATQRAVKAYVDGVGTATASTTVKGIAEVATQAEVDAGTATGDTGAPLIVTPETLKAVTAPVMQVYEVGDSPATWTKPAGLKYVIVEVVGGGGGGQSASSTSDASGGGGGAGGYSRKIISAASLGATETVTVGAGGAGGATGNFNDGTAGGSSSFGSHATAGGGGGGVSSVAAGGTASGGDLNITGNQGITSEASTGGTPNGGAGAIASAGRGGYGGINEDNAGQSGAPGVVIVTEFYV